MLPYWVVSNLQQGNIKITAQKKEDIGNLGLIRCYYSTQISKNEFDALNTSNMGDSIIINLVNTGYLNTHFYLQPLFNPDQDLLLDSNLVID